MSQRNGHLDRRKKPFSKFPSFETGATHAMLGTPVALRNLTPNMYMSTAEKYAELKHVRASEVSLCFLQFFTSTRNEQSAHITYCLNAMTVFEDHVRANCFFWPKGDFEYLIITMYNFQVSYIALAAMAVDAGKLRFGYPAKGHYLNI